MSAAFGWLGVLPPALAIGVALASRRVLPSLLAGVLCAVLILNPDAPHLAPARTLDYIVGILSEPAALRLVLFSLLIGALMKLIRESGGFDAFAQALQRRGRSHRKGAVFGLTWIFGASLILETWSNVLINGATMGPLYDRLGLSRARLAYFIHTIGINIVALVLINSWGAFYLALVVGQNVPNPVDFLAASMPYALYCWISLVVVAVVMATGLGIGPMRQFDADARAAQTGAPARAAEAATPGPKLRHMLVPIATLIGGVLFSLWATGNGDIASGDGSASILYAVAGAIVLTALLLRIDRVFSSRGIEEQIIAGVAEFLDVGILLVLALALGSLTQDLGVGTFIAQLLESTMPVHVLPALVFALGAVMSFATGTSYGTFSIMAPIALPIGAATGVSQELLFGACIAGGVFGDNCSPISDTSIVTGAAAGLPVIDHTRTQLPFALIAASLAVCGYLLLGFVEA